MGPERVSSFGVMVEEYSEVVCLTLKPRGWGLGYSRYSQAGDNN
jgi:hypothetical protein